MFDFDNMTVNGGYKLEEYELFLTTQPDGKYYADWDDCPFGGFTPYRVIGGNVFCFDLLVASKK